MTTRAATFPIELTWVRPLSIAGAAFLVLLPGLFVGPLTDQGIFVVVGEALTRGELPYLDIWDHKPPAIYLVTALASVLPGPTWPWVWLASVGALAATGYLLASLTSHRAALVAVVCMGLWPVAAGGGYTETFAVLAAVWAFTLVRQRPIAAGAAFGIAMLFSLQIAPAGLALVVMRRQVVIGSVAVAVLAAGILAVTGTLAAAFDALVTYNGAYAALDRTNDLRNAWQLLLPLVPLLLALRRPTRDDAPALVWLVGSIVVIAIQGRLFPHYLIPLIPPLAMLTGVVGWPSFVTLGMSVGISLALISGPRTPPLPAADRVLMWGHEPGVYLTAGEPVGRYPYLMPLVTPGYSTPAMVEAWVTELDADPPDLIVDSEAANPHWPEGEDFFRPPPPGAAGGRNLDIVEPFRAFVRERYELAAEVDGRKVYALRP